MQEDLFNLQNKIKDNKKKNKKIAITPFSIIELNDTQEVISNFKPLIKSFEINLLLDPVHPEKYSIPNLLWAMCIKGGDGLPPLKRK